MANMSEVSNTLYVPMGGRIYASEHFPQVFFDEMALSIKDQIPQEALRDEKQSEYTFMASASRCHNMDVYIQAFLEKHPSGSIVELGCGLETTYFRVDNGLAHWYELDLPEVIECREALLPCPERMELIRASAFDTDWMDGLSKQISKEPVLFLASGLFHYFEEGMVIKLFQDLQRFKHAHIVFDAVSKQGMKMTRKYMKQLEHDSAKMYFYCDSPDDLAKKIGGGVCVVKGSKFYEDIDKKGMKFMTRASMVVSDMLNMVKMIELKLTE